MELTLIAIGLAADAFAVAVCLGLSMFKPTLKHMLTVGLYFGVFQAGMPLIGYLLGTQFSHHVDAFGYWIAFAVLAFIGGKMMLACRKPDSCTCKTDTCQCGTLTHAGIIPLAFATSIDALIVGVSFSLLRVNIFSAVLLIGIVTLGLSTLGLKLGRLLGIKFKTKAEFFGGAVLVLMGLRILLGGLGVV